MKNEKRAQETGLFLKQFFFLFRSLSVHRLVCVRAPRYIFWIHGSMSVSHRLSVFHSVYPFRPSYKFMSVCSAIQFVVFIRRSSPQRALSTEFGSIFFSLPQRVMKSIPRQSTQQMQVYTAQLWPL